MIDFFLNDLLKYFLEVFVWLAFAATAGFYFWREKFANYKKINGVVAFVIFSARAAQAMFLTFGQYYIWSRNNLGKVFLNSPLADAVPIAEIFKNSFVFQNKFGYFIFYSYGRFWLNIIVVFVCSTVFYFFLKFLQKYKERFFENGETELGFTASLFVGWPNFVIFLPLVFISIIFISIYRNIFLGKLYTTLGWSFILATFLTLWFGSNIINFLNLNILKI